MSIRKAFFWSITISPLMTVPAAHAAFVVDYQQVGNNVVATGSGTLNISGLTLAQQGSSTEGAFVWGGAGIECTGPVAASEIETLTGVNPRVDFGTGDQIIPTSGTGQTVGISKYGFLDLQYGYPNGSALSDSSTWDDATIASLGLTPGTYTTTWGSGPTADSFTINIESSVPEPTEGLILAAATIVATARRRSVHTCARHTRARL